MAPADAEQADTDALYDSLAAAGFSYGSAFQGLRSVWQRGDALFAEVALPEDDQDDAAAYGLHPALLDAALHPLGLGTFVSDTEQGRMPFSWTGVTLHATGASALRVRLTAAGTDGVALVVADASGEPVATVDSLVLRPLAVPDAGAEQGTATTRCTASTGAWRPRRLPRPADSTPSSAPTSWGCARHWSAPEQRSRRTRTWPPSRRRSTAVPPSRSPFSSPAPRPPTAPRASPETCVPPSTTPCASWGSGWPSSAATSPASSS
ncbi:hypothetical protein SMD44_07602 [Streptomyces alboflavus]|uniref:PKS/mFAS DH domain-containing protein n=1 Tax=Streptomyces alboflavus TaxID=67267 RepID=A0A1Z1WNW3_9ACTN|nr:hypothetical protein SMD44_07602 [Streptomyces alboflavus]